MKKINICLLFIIMVCFFAVFLVSKNNNHYIIKDGAVIALTLDGVEINKFPSGNNYFADISCDGGVGRYQPVKKINNNLETSEYEIRFTIDNITQNVKCFVDFTTIDKSSNSEFYLINEVLRKQNLTQQNGGLCTNESYTTETSCKEAEEHWYTVEEKIGKNYSTGGSDCNAGIRYSGKYVNNYVWFNNELWRIIGVVPITLENGNKENLIKIIRNDSIGELMNDTSSVNEGERKDKWGENSLFNLMNNYYYGKKNATSNASSGCKTQYFKTHNGSSPTINAISVLHDYKPVCNYINIGISNSSTDYYGKMIERVYWNVGSLDNSEAEHCYCFEEKSSKLGYIGILSLSDYIYSGIDYESGVFGQDFANNSKYNWLFNGINVWTMTNSGSEAYYVQLKGNISNYDESVATSSHNVRPVVYLDPSVYIISGDGSEGNPYMLGM